MVDSISLRKFRTMTTLIVYLGAAHSAYANELFISSERIENCLRFSDDRYQYISSGAGACSDLPKGGSISGMTTCVTLERQYWLDHAACTLDRILQKANAKSPDLARGIQEMQSGWAVFRDELCKSKNQGDPEGDLRQGNCLMQQDGEQAIYLMGIAENHFVD